MRGVRSSADEPREARQDLNPAQLRAACGVVPPVETEHRSCIAVTDHIDPHVRVEANGNLVICYPEHCSLNARTTIRIRR
jgi:hypothetical protein